MLQGSLVSQATTGNKSTLGDRVFGFDQMDLCIAVTKLYTMVHMARSVLPSSSQTDEAA